VQRHVFTSPLVGTWQIAALLGTAETTARHHPTSILAKPGAGDRLELVTYPSRHGPGRFAS
jgi:DNA-binding CsgD family transcriptional regulator